MSVHISSPARQELGSVEGNGETTVASLAQQSEFQVTPATAGDHIPITHLLQTIFHGPSSSEFQSQLDKPDYEPTDRIVARRDGRLVGHVRTNPLVMQMGDFEVSTAWLTALGVLPEFRGRGVATSLLTESETQLNADGVELAFVRTDVPGFFARRGWVLCGRHSYSSAGTRKILAQISASRQQDLSPLARPAAPVHVRLWRHVEQDAISDIYNRQTENQFGAPKRNHAYWRWLISRAAFERIYVAVEGDDKSADPDEDTPAHIVGYAVVSSDRIIELFTDNHPEAARQLLARACADAIEADQHVLRVDAPPTDPLHTIAREAGGKLFWHEAEAGYVTMARLFQPLVLLENLRGQLFQRAKEAAIKLPTELGLQIDGEKHLISLTRRSAKLAGGRLSRSYLTCNQKTLVQLLLGHLDVVEAVASGRLEASTRVAIDTAAALFPRLPLWFPPLDHVAAD